MKILLISPAFFIKNKLDKYRELFLRMGVHGGDSPSLGLEYIASSLMANNHEASIIDLRVENKTEVEFKNGLKLIKPDLVGLYLTTFNIREAVIVAKAVKEVIPNIKIVVGGPHLGMYPKETLFHQVFDYALMGEAEYTFLSLVDVISGKGDIEKINGVVFRRNNEIKIIGQPETVENLDELPFPARKLLKGRYFYFGTFKEPFTTMITSRGCPFQCSFCAKIPGSQKVRFMSAKRVVEEFEEIKKIGYKEVNIFDDLFTVKRERVIDICKGLLEKKIDISWSVRARTDFLDEEMLTYMKKAGCYRIYFGIESGTDEILKLMNKQTTTKQNMETMKLVRKIGFEIVSYYIVGFPGETLETMQKTIEFAKKSPTDFVSFNVYLSMPASKTHKDMIALGKRDEWIDFIKLKTDKFPCYHGNLSRFEVEKAYKKAMREFYFRPKAIWNLLKMINSFIRLRNFLLTLVSIFMLAFLRKKVELKS